MIVGRRLDFSRKRLYLVLVLVGVVCGSSPARRPPPPYTHSALADSLIFQGAEYAYNLQFDLAESTLVRLVDIYPDHPRSYFFWAMCYWGRYVSDFEDTASYEEYLRLINKAIEVGEALLEREGENPETLFYLGGGYGFRGLSNLLKRNWLRAYIDGRKGKRLLERVIELEPGSYDAYLGTGIFYYYVDVLPRYLKLLTKLLMLGGDRRRGLRELELAADKGYFAATQAKLTLVKIYTDFENKPGAAMKLLDRLASRYPRNVWFLIDREHVHIRAARFDSALVLESALIDSCRAGARYFKEYWIPHFRFKMGVCNFRLGKYREAESIFRSLVEEKPDRPGWVYPWAVVQLGMTCDVTGRREEARACYRRVIRLRDKQGSRRWARSFLRKAYRPGDSRRYPDYFWNGAPLEGRYFQ